MPLHALRERGVEYIEVRCMDLDPFVPVGIATQTMRFLDVFLLHCLLSDSPPDTPQEIAALARNLLRAADRGREPGLLLERGEALVTLQDWGAEILDECDAAAAALDAGARRQHCTAMRWMRRARCWTTPRSRHRRACSRPWSRSSTARTPRSRGRNRCRPRAGCSRCDFPPDLQARFAAMAEASVAEQRRIEAADTMPFEAYRQAYLSIDRLGV